MRWEMMMRSGSRWIRLLSLFGCMICPDGDVWADDPDKGSMHAMAEAMRMRDAGRHDEACGILETYLEAHPDDQSVLQMLVHLSKTSENAPDREGLAPAKGEATSQSMPDSERRARILLERARGNLPEAQDSETEPGDDWLSGSIQRGRAQLLGGDYEGAGKTFAEIEVRYPDHPEVRRLQIQLAEALRSGNRLNRARTREDMINEVDRLWQRPMVFEPELDQARDVNGENPLLAKIRAIRIPRVSFSNVELTAVIETLSELSVEHDLTPGPGPRGVNIIPLYDPNTRTDPKVSISLRNLSLEKILQFVSQQVNFQYDIVEDAIVVQPSDGPDGAANVLTEFFPVSRATVIRLVGGKAGASLNEPSYANPFDTSSGNGAPEGGSVGEEELALKSFFQRAGVDFAGVRGASLAFDGTQLIATQTARNLERMRSILRRYDKTRQVEIEAKFLEVEQEDLDELGLHWKWNADGTQLFDPNGNPLMRSDGKPVMEYRSGLSSAPSNRTLADAFAINQELKTVSITSPGRNLEVPFKPPVIPQALSFAQDVAGGILNSVGIIGNTELNVILRALSRKEGSDLLSAPRLTVLSGKTASITVAQELIYPQSYGDMQAQVSRATANSMSGDGVGAVAITAGTPRDFSKRNIGVEMQVTPTVEDDDNISLLLEPKVTEFEGFVEYGGPSVAISGDLSATVPSGFYQPIFSTRSVRTEVTIYDGATVVIGGLTREETQVIDDKVPLLGDIPFIGRVFRSEGQATRKRNLIIFVTANLIGPGGGPIKQEFGGLGNNALFQNPVLLTPGGSTRRRVPAEDSGE